MRFNAASCQTCLRHAGVTGGAAGLVIEESLTEGMHSTSGRSWGFFLFSPEADITSIPGTHSKEVKVVSSL